MATQTQDTTPLEQIVEALNLNDLLPEEQEEILLDLNGIIFKGSMVRLVERMDEKTRDEFSALMDSDPSEEAVEAFLAERMPEADSAVAETIQDLTDDILAVSKPNT